MNTVITGALPDPRVGCYVPPDAVDALDREVFLFTCCPKKERRADRMVWDQDGALLLNEYDHSAPAFSYAFCGNCLLELGGPYNDERICALSPPLHVGEVDGIPLPEPSFGLIVILVMVTLYAWLTRNRRRS